MIRLQYEFDLAQVIWLCIAIAFVKQFFYCVLKMSDINFKQLCAFRFCFKLGHSATETLAKLQQAYGDCVLSRAQVFSSLRHFQKEESRLKMNLEAEGLHLQELIKMSTESEILCVQIVS